MRAKRTFKWHSDTTSLHLRSPPTKALSSGSLAFASSRCQQGQPLVSGNTNPSVPMLCLAQRAEASMMKRLLAHFQNHVRQARSVLKWLARRRKT